MEIKDIQNQNDLIIANVVQTLEKTINNQDLTIKQFNIFNALDALNIVSKSLKKEALLMQNFKIGQINKSAISCFLCEKLNDKTDFFYSLTLKDQELCLCSICCASIKTMEINK